MPVNSVNGQDGNLVLPRGIPDPVSAETLSSISPTITLTQQSTSTIASAQALFTPDLTPFSYTAGMAFSTPFPDTTLYQPVSRYPYTWSSPPFWSVTFGTDATTFEFLFKYVSAATLYRLSLDNRKVTDLMQSTGASSVGSRHVLKFALGSTAPRKVRLDFYTMPFGGIFVGPNDSVWKVPMVSKRLMVLGDSLSGGSSENTGSGAGTWFHRFARVLGYDDHWNSSIGGTGYIADNSGGSVPFGTRTVSDVVTYAPDRLIIWGGYNDNAQSQSAIGLAADAVYRTVNTYLDCYTVVIGCWSPSGSPAASLVNTDETLRVSAAKAGFPFISPITGKVYDARGALLPASPSAPWITTANASRFIGADATHPNDAGHTQIARRIAEAYTLLGNP